MPNGVSLHLRILIGRRYTLARPESGATGACRIRSPTSFSITTPTLLPFSSNGIRDTARVLSGRVMPSMSQRSVIFRVAAIDMQMVHCSLIRRRCRRRKSNGLNGSAACSRRPVIERRISPAMACTSGQWSMVAAPCVTKKSCPCDSHNKKLMRSFRAVRSVVHTTTPFGFLRPRPEASIACSRIFRRVTITNNPAVCMPTWISTNGPPKRCHGADPPC